MRPINEIIVHCTATPEGRPVSVAEIDAWHRARGWSGIGYHRVIDITGARLAGRPLSAVGAHCAGHNDGTIGVVYVGGLAADGRTPKDTRTPAQRRALAAELMELRDRFNIRKISGHNEYAAKACPSFDASAEYDHLFEGRERLFKPIVDHLLQRGDAGQFAQSWRDQLITWRENRNQPSPLLSSQDPDDLFGHAVEAETLAFQRERQIVADGVVGPQTRNEMRLALNGRPPFSALENYQR
ncbi:peptidoglycan recognition protein family protein [Pannonibacter sp. SL95]|uniref:peptidoglycan recognition protein family protein n=1 Tax=Pannonibacter sp. SL95 TaxID=2995153 RepID=UPI0022758FB7|nr:peptidoglycan-binding domain-containing protein [Pannonibacter sp. SL95]MCY1705222.1 peptidoglycan-binding domain-containing protein [Pannonibacter sp. SL95]